MSEYSRIRNQHDRAVILAQLVNADARVVAAAVAARAQGVVMVTQAEANFNESRAELWKLIGPRAVQGEPGEEKR